MGCSDPDDGVIAVGEMTDVRVVSVRPDQRSELLGVLCEHHIRAEPQNGEILRGELLKLTNRTQDVARTCLRKCCVIAKDPAVGSAWRWHGSQSAHLFDIAPVEGNERIACEATHPWA